MAIPSEGLRICITCLCPKSVGEFYGRSRRDGGGPGSECKLCTRKRTKARYNRDKAIIRPIENARKRKMGAELKDRVFRHYGGWICACCNERERLFLTLDHINNDGAEFRRMITGDQARGGGQITYRWLEKNGYPSGFQVLCSNCQHGKRMNGGICPHQTTFNDQRQALVGSSEPKRNAPERSGDDMVSSANESCSSLIGSWSENPFWPHSLLKGRVQ